MAIFFGRRPEEQFTRVPNLWARDPKLSLKAKGLLTYILSHQDGYRLTMEQVLAENSGGKTVVYSALRELVERGYLRRVQRRGALGKVGEVDYYVADAPDVTASQFSVSGFPASGSSAYGKPESGDDQGEQDVYAGQTASGFSASGETASGKPATKKNSSKKTKVLEDKNKTTPSPAPDPLPPAPADAGSEEGKISQQDADDEGYNQLIDMRGYTEIQARFLIGVLNARYRVASPQWWRDEHRAGRLDGHLRKVIADYPEEYAEQVGDIEEENE